MRKDVDKITDTIHLSVLVEQLKAAYMGGKMKKRCLLGLIVVTVGVTAQTAWPADCMQDVYKAGGGSGSLNCNSNDVRIAKVTNITNVSGITGTYPNQSCIAGSPIEFTADFEVVLGATGGARYDIGLYLAQGQAQALTGTCNSSIITANNALHFDQEDATLQPTDSCGDISGTLGSTFNPQIVHLDIKTTCTAGTGGKLLLPNCTSWRQPGSNALCTSINNAFPGSPSKCNCDNTFTIDVTVEHPSLVVTKTAIPTQLNEPGGNVDYTVTIHNPAVAASVTLTELTEDDTNDGVVDFTYNSLSNPTLSSICDSTTLAPCGSDPSNCAAASTTTCTFSRNVTGNAGATTTDKACVSGMNGGAVGPSCATASVSIKDVVPTAAVTKTVEKAVCAVVRYDVQVDNTDLVESLNLTALSDNQFGDITKDKNSTPVANALVDRTDCSVPQTIAVSGNYKCTFDALVCSFPHSNKVTATLNDNDSNTIEKDGSATVTGVTLQ